MKTTVKIIQISQKVNIDTDFELMFARFLNSIEERLFLYQKLAEIQSKNELQNLKMN